jgi:hypothetical protein
MPDSSSLIGLVISHYRIVEKLGAGGMGEVYRARDERLKRDVAFKILTLDPQGSAETGKKILREAQSASALNDPHICTIHEVGEAAGYHFMVMELVEGSPLNSLIPPEGLRPELARRSLPRSHTRTIEASSIEISRRPTSSSLLQARSRFWILVSQGPIATPNLPMRLARHNRPPTPLRSSARSLISRPKFSEAKKPAHAAISGRSASPSTKCLLAIAPSAARRASS